MSVEEIKCPHKGLDSGGLRCFLSRAQRCDNCFSNIRNLPPSKPELKEGRKKKKKTSKREDFWAGSEHGAGSCVAQSRGSPVAERYGAFGDGAEI